MLAKKSSAKASGKKLKDSLNGVVGQGVDRRSFLKKSGIAMGGVALAGTASPGIVKKAKAQTAKADVKKIKSICTHCSVGCTVMAEVDKGVWTGQEPGFDSPFNLGGHCAKGASVREHAHNERRLKYPMKLTGGKWQRVSWEQAINDIGDKMLDIRKASGPDSVYWLGSAKFNNEQSYLFRKFYAFWGSNNGDHQARICHSTTVAGVANTWGYGAMTNSYNDMHNSRSMFLIGSNPAEAHPVAVQHILRAKERNNAALIVCDPRFTRTAAHADEYVRFRPGTDVALIWGILHHIFKNGWEDKEFIRQRVWGLEQIKAEVKNWTPEETERVTGVPGAQLKRVARTLANNRPGTIVWCMGGTQHTNGNNNTRAYCILQLALGNMGKAGGGANIFRGHDNVQGATDFCILSHSLPGYYGLSSGAWKHWSRVWDVDYDYIKGRFATKKLMESKGIPVSRWIDGVLEQKEKIDQPDNVRAMVLWGHAVNSQTRLPEMKKAMEKLDLMVIIDPVPTFASVIPDRQDGVYVLPAATQYETYGSVTASNRSLQWRDKVIEPIFEAKPDHEVMYLFAKKLGFEKEMFKNIKVNDNEPFIEDITREFNGGMWTIGYTGQSPERMRKQMANQHTFDRTTLQANGGPCDGEYYGLPWPCWGTPEMGHPGTPILYDPSKSIAEGGLTFRARFGVQREGTNLLAEGSYSVGSEIKDGYPEFTMAMLKKLGWDGDLTAAERASIEKVAGDKTNWKTDLSGGIQRVAIKHGCAPFGNAKARTVVWTFPDPVPLHREPLYTPRRDLLPKYETYKDKQAYRLPTKFASIQKNDFSKDFPTILTSGRLVEYEGGGDESRANKWLAELQQEMFLEINPRDANNLGIRAGGQVWVHSPEGGKVLVAALITERVASGVVFMPFHFGGHWQGKSLRDKYPPGADPYVLGEAMNMCGTYGYDSVTQMQETKVTLCRVEAA
ncbi:MAG: formate dehydrogenase subunit alpha [Alphaproteobacteria bacterium]|jgi:formate dehydrogenase major subunit|nr:formate dehydrogenase subunit alpha [Alphaproteobacteria bacterium]MBT4967353.1 formate dehydrogenase subunit alpha [Alphaproteobacteria bacterium]MBT5160578.1 formate dehydrogenase subunit alpha [Alphaproteobacteria bacterium]